MPPTKSKRIPLRQKHKIERKVREHNRKLKRMNKKNPKKLKKDPGVPNLWPFKQEVLEEISQHKSRLQEAEQRKKEQRQKEVEKRRRREEQERNEKKKQKAVETSQRTYMKQFQKVVQTADVILEVLDARDPLGCRCQDIEQTILRTDPSKKIILVLNKIDLIPKENVLAWLKYLRSQFPTVGFKASLQKQRRNISQEKGDIDAMSSEKLKYSEVCLGADTLMKLLKNYCRTSSGNNVATSLKTSITVGVIGYPNVGKSSLINSLKRSKVCNVGSTPGLTTATQEVHLDKNVKLIDCPGIVFNAKTENSGELILRNCVKVEQLEDPLAPVEILVKRCTPSQLQKIYDIPPFRSPEEFLNHVATAKGKLKKGGVGNLEAAARLVLRDWNSGKITFFTVPPERTNLVESTIVTEMSKEFNLDDLFDEEKNIIISTLPDEVDTSYIPSAAEDKKYGLVVKEKKGDQTEGKKESVFDSHNPQRNKELKKLQKQKKKQIKKSEEDGEEEEEEEEDAPYDFSVDFEQNDEEEEEDEEEEDNDDEAEEGDEDDEEEEEDDDEEIMDV